MEIAMGRTTDMGLLIFGIVLGVIGAIMRFAVEVTTEGFNIHTAGVILLVVGVLAGLVGLVLVLMGRTSRTRTTETTQATPMGQVRTQESTNSSSER